MIAKFISGYKQIEYNNWLNANLWFFVLDTIYKCVLGSRFQITYRNIFEMFNGKTKTYITSLSTSQLFFKEGALFFTYNYFTHIYV